MTLNTERNGRRMWVGLWAGFTLILLALVPVGRAQAGENKTGDSKTGETKISESKPSEARARPVRVYETLYLVHATGQNNLNDIQTDLRNVLPEAKIYGVASQNAITLIATAEDLALARKVVAELDRPRKAYRLTYTVAESGAAEDSRQAGEQHYALIAVSGEKTDFKQGSRVPLVTGMYDAADAKSNSQVQYIDIGLNIEATLESSGPGVRLRTKVEESSVAEEKSVLGVQDPVIRQTQLESTSMLVLGKAVVLGAVDVPGSRRKREISVVAEAVL